MFEINLGLVYFNIILALALALALAIAIAYFNRMPENYFTEKSS
jgi:hypothetical protein